MDRSDLEYRIKKIIDASECPAVVADDLLRQSEIDAIVEAIDDAKATWDWQIRDIVRWAIVNAAEYLGVPIDADLHEIEAVAERGAA